MSVQLIKKDAKSGLISVNKEGLDVIKQINGPISICLIVGPYRQGKSFLMNRLISYQENTFSVGNTDNSCTKGIWISKNPIKISNDSYLVFADTEGLDSDECDEAWDTKLFLLSLSICSIFIYNTKNALSNDAFNKLSVMANLSERLRIKSNVSNVYNNIHLKENCPKFVWIVRDYTLRQTLKPNERLNKFLTVENESGASDKKSKEIKIRNEIKESMIKLFKSFDCFYLKYPESENPSKKPLSEFIQSLNEIKFEEISKEFRDSFEEFRTFIYNNIEAKVINNETMNGAVFCEYLKNLIKLINTDECINLHDILTESAKSVAENVLSEAKKRYIDEMENLFVKKKFFEKKDFINNENKISRDILDWMKTNIVGSKSLQSNFIDKFEEFRQVKNESGNLTGGKFYEFEKKNELLASSHDDEIFKNAKNKYIDEMNKYLSPNSPKSWNDFYRFEKELNDECIKMLKDSLITSSKSKFENDFNQFKGDKSYDNKPYSGKLLEFYKINEKKISEKNEEIASNNWDSIKMNKTYSKKADFIYALDSFKSSLKNKLFECSDYESFWDNFKRKKNVDGIMNSINETVYDPPRRFESNNSILPNLIFLQSDFSRPPRQPSPEVRDDSCTCPICGQICKNQHGLSIHIGRMHKNSEPEFEDDSCTCPICGKTCKNEHGLSIHMGRMHK